MKRGWINDDWIFILESTVPLKPIWHLIICCPYIILISRSIHLKESSPLHGKGTWKCHLILYKRVISYVPVFFSSDDGRIHEQTSLLTAADVIQCDKRERNLPPQCRLCPSLRTQFFIARNYRLHSRGNAEFCFLFIIITIIIFFSMLVWTSLSIPLKL